MVGFPHSEILGSKLVRSSPRLIAAYYVLHRLHAPRHPLDALKALDRSHYRCPQPNPHPPLETDEKKSSGIVDRSDQINQNSRAVLSLPGVRVKQAAKHLFTMSKDPAAASNVSMALPNLLFVLRRYVEWWSRTGSNRRPEACKATALPTELRPLGWLANRLSPGLVGPGRLELPTSRLSGVRSNHLSYGPSGSRQRAGSRAGERRASAPR